MQKYMADSLLEAQAIQEILDTEHEILADISEHNLIVSWLGEYELTNEDWELIQEYMDLHGYDYDY